MNLFIFDLDGTLADITHRVHYVKNKPKNWKAFNAGIPHDKPKAPIVKLLQTLRHHPDTRVVICSGRNEDSRTETEVWLIENKIDWDELYMRKKDDFRDDTIVKKEMLAQVRAEWGEPDLVIDDRQKVVDMWRKEGLTCLQCDVWEE